MRKIDIMRAPHVVPDPGDAGELVRPWIEPGLARRLGGHAMETFFRWSSAAGRAVPIAHPRVHGVEHLRDVAFCDTHGLRLDVWRPRERAGLRPVVLYLHGGGFRILSKDSHWIFGLGYSRRGFVTFMPDYRLAPRHPFPAAIEDACRALLWVREHAAEYGGDPSRIVVAGESAGANLSAALAIAASWRRPEPFARAVFDAGVRIAAVKAACGLFQVTAPERFRAGIHPFVYARIAECADAYLKGVRRRAACDLDLADPLLFLEAATAPERPLPPFFAPVGTLDPLAPDTRRLAAALGRLGVACEDRYYLGHHAFHAFVFLPSAVRCWNDGFDFLDRHVR